MLDFAYNQAASGGVTSTPRKPNHSGRQRAFMAINQIPANWAEAQPIITCRVCDAGKFPDDFYKNHIRKGGSVGECKDCTKARVKARARTNPKVQEYDRARAKTPERRAKSREITARWRVENDAGYKAHTAVSNALRDGRLLKEACLFCSADEVHAHHRDYAKPLDVIWLCPKCHHRLHANFPETEGANKAS